MTRTRWKTGANALLALPIFLTGVNAVSLTQCSSQNTGSGGQSSTSIYMTNGQCHDNCQGYAFAITQWQNCWCSNEAPGQTTSVGSCNQHCPGYPTESCGNQQEGLFGYVALGPSPQGTMGAGGGGGGSGSSSSTLAVSSSAPAPSSIFIAPSSSVPPPQPSTQVIVSSQPPQTIVQTQVNTQVSTYTPPASSAAPVVVTHTEQNTETQISSVAPSTILREPSTAIVTGPTSTVTPTPLVVTSAQAITVGGSIVTHFITSVPTPTPVPSSAQSNEMPQQTQTGLSTGAVAGVTVGAIAAALLIAALIFLFVRRRKASKQSADSESGAPKRNASVLSRVGLLRNSNRSEDAAGPSLPQIYTSGVPVEPGPESANTYGSSQMSENHRNSRPLFSDQRLNPNALMTQTNLSRTSVSTLQDNQDYSRPLEVRNPDRPSTARTISQR